MSDESVFFHDDDVYLGPWHDRDPNEPPELDDDDYPDDDDPDLLDETPDDRRAIIALRWRREWMATR